MPNAKRPSPLIRTLAVAFGTSAVIAPLYVYCHFPPWFFVVGILVGTAINVGMDIRDEDRHE